MAVRDVKVRLVDGELEALARVRAVLQSLDPEKAVTDADVLRACLREADNGKRG